MDPSPNNIIVDNIKGMKHMAFANFKESLHRSNLAILRAEAALRGRFWDHCTQEWKKLSDEMEEPETASTREQKKKAKTVRVRLYHIIWTHLYTSQRRWRVLISAVRAASKFRWWAHANLNLPVKPAMDDYRAVKALGFENIKEVDDKLHWADILATKVLLK